MKLINIDKGIFYGIGEEIEAIKDPDIAELEGATEMDAPMLVPGYAYEQRMLDYEEEEKQAKAPIAGASPSPHAILTQTETNLLNSANMTLREKYKDDLASYVKVLGEGGTTGSLELGPEIAYHAIKTAPAAANMLLNVGLNIGGKL